MVKYCQFCGEHRAYAGRFCPGCTTLIDTELAQTYRQRQADQLSQVAGAELARRDREAAAFERRFAPAPPLPMVARRQSAFGPGLAVLLLVIGVVVVALLVIT